MRAAEAAARERKPPPDAAPTGTVSPAPDTVPAARILVVGPSWVGDMVMSSSLLQRLKQRFPGRAIDVLAPAWTQPLLARMPEVDKVLPAPFSHGRLDLAARLRLARELRGCGYERAILLPNSLKSALVPWLARIPVRTGWLGEQRHGLVNDVRRLERQRLPGMVERFVALAEEPGWVPAGRQSPRPYLRVDPAGVRAARERLGLEASAAPVLALCPGAEYGAAKRWPAEHFGWVARACVDAGWQVWLMGSANDAVATRAVNEAAGGRCLDLAGRTRLEEAIDLLSAADAVVSNDSGLMHVAAALDRPLAAVFGSSDPRFTPPLSQRARVLYLGVECSPCFQRECPLRHLRCLRALAPQRVLAALAALETGIPAAAHPAAPWAARVRPRPRESVDPPTVALVKISSLGDVLHALPAVTDASRALPGIRFDWVVEESFAEIPAWHPAVRRVIPVASRRWRRRPQDLLRGEGLQVLRALRRERYSQVIDAQGLVKSALFALAAHGTRHGLSASTVREPVAALCYRHRHHVTRRLHAVDRLRALLAAALDYEPPAGNADYGIDRARLPAAVAEPGQVLFLHGTSWPAKEWPVAHWQALARLAVGRGFRVALPWGNETERLRAEAIAESTGGVRVLPRSSLGELAALLAAAEGAVAVDTGLGHLAAALGTPCVSLYGPTSPARVGTRGASQRHLVADFPCSPCQARRCRYRGPSTVTPACYDTLPPHAVLQALLEVRAKADRVESAP